MPPRWRVNILANGNCPWNKWVEVQLLVLVCGSTSMFIVKMFSYRVLKIYVYIWVGFKVMMVKLQINERFFCILQGSTNQFICHFIHDNCKSRLKSVNIYYNTYQHFFLRSFSFYLQVLNIPFMHIM